MRAESGSGASYYDLMVAYPEKLPLRLHESFRCFDRRENSLPARFHQHDEIELTYVPTGRGERLIGDHVGRYSNHDLVLIGGNLPHTWADDAYRGKSCDMHEAIVLYFKDDFLGGSFFEIPEAARIRDLLNQAHRGIWFPPEFAKTIGGRMMNITQLTGMKRITELLQCLELMCECRESVVLASEGFSVAAKDCPDTRIDVVIDYINSHFTDWELRAHRLAEVAEMNKSAFSRRFKTVTGQTPTEYVNRLRLGYSRRLLLNRQKSVTNVCHASGFSSLSYFNKLFRTRFGMSPSEFRKSHLIVHDSSTG